MNWLNIELKTLRSEEFVGCDPVARATWLCLMAFCADQENGGRIKDCLEWGDRRCMQLIGITREEMTTRTNLWSFDGDDLIVNFYPVDKEAEVKAKREAGKRYGKAKTANPHEQRDSKLSDSSANSSAISSALTERKGKERNRKGIGIGKEGKKGCGEKTNDKSEELKLEGETDPIAMFPDNLRTPAFVAAWSEWERHRTEIRKPLTPRAVTLQLRELSDAGEPVAIKAIHQSITSGWQGLFPEKVAGAKTQTLDNTTSRHGL